MLPNINGYIKSIGRIRGGRGYRDRVSINRINRTKISTFVFGIQVGRRGIKGVLLPTYLSHPRPGIPHLINRNYLLFTDHLIPSPPQSPRDARARKHTWYGTRKSNTTTAVLVPGINIIKCFTSGSRRIATDVDVETGQVSIFEAKK